MRRIATCACGELKAIAEGEPDQVLACNCRACQQRTGSVFGVSAYFSRSNVRIEGEARTFVRETEDGLRFETRFCGSCGTSVLWSASAMPDHVAIAVGCFADPDFPPPTRAAWLSEKHPWVCFPEDWQGSEKSALVPTLPTGNG